MATVGFGLESANVVGYASTSLQQGFTAAGASFVNVSDGTLKFGDISVTGYGDDGYADNMIIVQTLTANGKPKDTYYWADYTEGKESWFGWYNADWSECYNEVPLAPGDGLWIQAPSADISIMSAGAVPAAGIAVNLVAGGFKLVANPMPAPINLGLITISGYGDSYADNMIVAQTLTANGKPAAEYIWADYSEGEESWYGWYNADWSTDYNAEPVDAGVGLWVQAPGESNLKINFPSPL